MASKHKVVLITGCSSGIGLSLAVRLARDEEKRFKVYATMRNLEKKASLETEGKEVWGKTLLVRQLDVCSDESVEKTVTEILKTEGRVDVLVNNAGIGLFGILEAQSMELMKKVFETNYFGLVRVTKAVLPNMKMNKSGLIVNISSAGGIIGVPCIATYCASKFAVEGFAESMAALLKEFNINCILIEPGQVATEFVENRKQLVKEYSKVTNEDVVDEKSAELREAVRSKFQAQLSGPLSDKLCQTADEVARITVDAILAEKPHFRYQTNQMLNGIVEAKLADPTGDSIIEATNSRFFPKQT